MFDGVSENHHNGVFGDSISIPVDAHSPEERTIREGPVSKMSSPTSSPTFLPRSSLRLEILYDFYPEETSWSLVDKISGTEVAGSVAGSATTPMKLVPVSIPGLVPGQLYTLTIQDAVRDGICCGFGKGSVRAVLVSSTGEESVVWSHPGDFGAAIQTTISVLMP